MKSITKVLILFLTITLILSFSSCKVESLQIEEIEQTEEVIEEIQEDIAVEKEPVIEEKSELELKLEAIEEGELKEGIISAMEEGDLFSDEEKIKFIEDELSYLEAYNYIINLAPNLPGIINRVEKEDLIAFYEDILNTEIEWDEVTKNGRVIEKYIIMIFDIFNDHTYDENDKRLIEYLGDKDNLFRELLIYYKPLENIDNLEDIDNDGLYFDEDPYPLNYSNGKFYLIWFDGNTSLLEGYPDGYWDWAEKQMNFLKKSLSLENNIIYVNYPNISEFENTINNVLSNTTENDIIMIVIDQHGGTDNICLNYDYGGTFDLGTEYDDTYDPYYPSQLNKLFINKEYGAVFLILNSCFSYYFHQKINIEKSVSISVGKDENYGGTFITSIVNALEYDKSLLYNTFVYWLEKEVNALGGETKIIVNGSPLLPENQEDWVIIPANYEK